jgi:hypothetical protein
MLIFNLPLFCSASDITYKFPNNAVIRDYVACTSKLTSLREGNFIIPSYEIILEKKTDINIRELEIKINYYYGQNFHFINNSYFILDDEQLNIINKTGKIIIKKELEKMPREELTIKRHTFRYTEPDGEYLEDIFYKLTLETQ